MVSGPQPPGYPRNHGPPPGPQARPSRSRATGASPRRGTGNLPLDENPTETIWLAEDSAAGGRPAADSYAGDLFEDSWPGAPGGNARGHGVVTADYDSGDGYYEGEYYGDEYYDESYDDADDYYGYEHPGDDYFDGEYRDDVHSDGGYYDDEYSDAESYDDERAAPVYYGDEYYDERGEPPRSRRRGKRAFGWVAALAVIVLLAAGAYYGARALLGFGYDDYDGPGQEDVVIRVEEGDTTGKIARTLADADVVASAEAFITASEANSEVRAVQPGYYQMKTKESGDQAAERIVADDAHVGNFEIEPGRQLEDVTLEDDSTIDGVLQRLAEASCAELGGKDTCVSVDDLSDAISETDPVELGVPEWAAEEAADGESVHKLEGLIMPGDYDIRPGSSATELLQQVLETSSNRLQAAGLPDSAGELDPYEVLVTASVIQREGTTPDFEKVSRVIRNRLDDDMMLRMDSTINYLNDTQSIRTTADQRAKDNPYNTYRNRGLPPTPISSPGSEAIAAALHPADGDWKYFVKCESDGTSCFTDNYAEHQQEVADAQERGVY